MFLGGDFPYQSPSSLSGLHQTHKGIDYLRHGLVTFFSTVLSVLVCVCIQSCKSEEKWSIFWYPLKTTTIWPTEDSSSLRIWGRNLLVLRSPKIKMENRYFAMWNLDGFGCISVGAGQTLYLPYSDEPSWMEHVMKAPFANMAFSIQDRSLHMAFFQSIQPYDGLLPFHLPYAVLIQCRPVVTILSFKWIVHWSSSTLSEDVHKRNFSKNLYIFFVYLLYIFLYIWNVCKYSICLYIWYIAL